jgi:elongation factor Ts
LQISTSTIKELRERTGAGVMDCKRALEESEGNLDRAQEILFKQGVMRADKKAGRLAQQGLIESYIHAGGRIGAMVELNCETDFVARTDDFRQLAHDLAMQVAATGPTYVSADEVPASEAERVSELALLAQPFIRDSGVTVEDLIKRHVAKLGEAIRVSRFSRFAIGESSDGSAG